MPDPREHWCRCGAWAAFGYKPPKGDVVWGCALVDGMPQCAREPKRVVLAPADPPRSEAATRKDAELPASVPLDLFGGA